MQAINLAGEAALPAWPSPVAALARNAAAAAAAVLLLLGGGLPGPAHAELQTVTAREAEASARPLAPQPVNKGRIWLLFVLGGAALFGSTIVLENNETFFPAISRANKAMRATRQRADQARAVEADEEAAAEAEAQRLATVHEEREDDARLQSAVLAGLQEAKQQVTAEEPSAGAAPEPRPEPLAAAASGSPAGEQQGETSDRPGEQGEDEEGRQPQEPAASAAESPAGVEEAAQEEEEEEEEGGWADGGSGREPRVLYEITPEQVQRSVERQQQAAAIAQLEEELARRRVAGASSSSPPDQ
eukprot:scaffold5.g808.t1